MPYRTMRMWIRARLKYPFSYTHEWYFNNSEKFHFPSEAERYFRILLLRRFDEELKVNEVIYFGYDQLGLFCEKDCEILNKKDISEKLVETTRVLIAAYEKFKNYFVSQICPKNCANDNYSFFAERILIDISEFLEALDRNDKVKVLKQLTQFLKNYVRDPQVVIFSKELENLATEKVIKSVDFNEEKEFFSIEIICERIYLFIYHYSVTMPFWDPSQGLLDCAQYGFFSSLKILDLHYSVKELFRKISEENKKIELLKKSKLKRGLSLYRRRAIELEEEARTCEKRTSELVNFAHALHEGLKSPYDYSFSERPEYYLSVYTLLSNMDSLPESLFEAGGFLETYQMGGLRNYVDSVRPLKTEIKTLNLHVKKQKLRLFIGLLILMVIAPSGLFYLLYGKLELTFIADLVQILTFVIALLILLLDIWPKH